MLPRSAAALPGPVFASTFHLVGSLGGRFVNSTTPPARYARYDQDLRDQQAIYGIPDALMRAVIKTESDFDPGVVSSAGAQGLMQLMPDTARLMGVTDPFDARQSIMGGARYLQVLARRFCKQVTSAGTVCAPDEKVKIVAAYNAGPGAVEKYGGTPPYETTQLYVAAVMRRYDELSGRAPQAQVDAGRAR